MSEKLKPCPFCGGEAEKYAKEYNGIRLLSVVCKACGTSGPLYRTAKPRIKDSENPAIEAWNTRKPMDKIVEQLEERASFVTKEGLWLISLVEATSIVKKGGVSDD